MKNFQELFAAELREIYCSECQSFKKLDEVQDKATSEKLREAIKNHASKTQFQIKRLEEMAKEAKVDLSRATCPVMDGLWKEWDQYKSADYEADVLDAAIIAFLQKVEHFEIASYGALRSYAKLLQYKKCQDFLSDSVKEEGGFDKKLTEIADGTMFGGGVNAKACKKCA